MRILYMVFHFPPISGGGVIVVSKIANALAELGHEITVITPDVEWNGEKYNPKLHHNIEVIRTETPSRNNIKIAARRCYKNLRDKGIELGGRKSYDFVFSIFHPFHFAPKAAVSCAKKLKIPSIIKIDDAIYAKSTGLKSIQRKIEKRYNSKTLQNSSKVLVMNENTKELVEKYYNINKEKVSIVPNGVGLKQFESKLKRKRQIIFSGVMYEHRGLDILMKAVPIIIKKYVDVQIVLVGNGPELENIKKIVKDTNIESNITFLGWVEHEKIPKILKESIIGIGPLRSTDVTKNALPIKILEYMAASLAIIAKNETIPSDILIDGENGFFINDSTDLAEKIIKLLENEEILEKFGKNSRKIVEKFDWENIAKMIINDYSKLTLLKNK